MRPHDCDILIGIFWTRFGTPGNDGRTGTEHEIQLAYESWEQRKRPEIMLYFKTGPVSIDTIEPEQLKRMVAFKDSPIFKKALYGTFDDLETFANQLRNGLIRHVRSLATGDLSERRGHPGDPAPVRDWQRIKLPDAMLHTFSGLNAETRDDDLFQDFRIDNEDNPNARESRRSCWSRSTTSRRTVGRRTSRFAVSRPSRKDKGPRVSSPIAAPLAR